ncbi:MAG TPA: ABC transporter substrate-binding protein, partial [Acidimicrobiia bacterium]|nr:ABC transporter substrate-binding protein [Acidimicrobiia bacterium]
MRSSRMKFVVLVFGVLGLLAAACGSSDDSGGASGGPDKVKLTLQWVTQAQFAGYHAALDQGFYADENLDVTIQSGGPDINPIQLLISGDSDIVIQPFGVVLTSRDAGADVVSMGQVFERGAFRLVYFDDLGIDGVPDWAGKTIGLWGGFEPKVSAAFGKYGMNVDSDANIFSQGWDMFLDGQLDLASAMTYNEYAQALAGNESDREILLWNPNEEGTNTLEDSLVTTEAWLAANPDIAERFIRATGRGWIYCRDNPDSCID